MALIPSKNYAKAHLEEVKYITGISDWFSFLDLPDRLTLLMEKSEPPSSEFLPIKAGASTWDWLALMTGPDNFYGLWVNTTPQEMWINQQIVRRTEEWLAICGFHDPTCEDARAIVERYERLIGLARAKLT